MDRATERKLRKAATRALKETIALAKLEPRIILIAPSAQNETDEPIDEITAWLFKRRQDDGHSGN